MKRKIAHFFTPAFFDKPNLPRNVEELVAAKIKLKSLQELQSTSPEGLRVILFNSDKVISLKQAGISFHDISQLAKQNPEGASEVIQWSYGLVLLKNGSCNVMDIITMAARMPKAAHEILIRAEKVLQFKKDGINPKYLLTAAAQNPDNIRNILTHHNPQWVDRHQRLELAYTQGAVKGMLKQAGYHKDLIPQIAKHVDDRHTGAAVAKTCHLAHTKAIEEQSSQKESNYNAQRQWADGRIEQLQTLGAMRSFKAHP